MPLDFRSKTSSEMGMDDMTHAIAKCPSCEDGSHVKRWKNKRVLTRCHECGGRAYVNTLQITFVPRNNAAVDIPATGMQNGDTEPAPMEMAGTIPMPNNPEEQRCQAVSRKGEGKVPTTASNDQAQTPLAIRPAGIEGAIADQPADVSAGAGAGAH